MSDKTKFLDEKAKVEYVNLLRHEVHNAHFDRIETIRELTGINYKALQEKYKDKAMDVWHQQVRAWISARRYPNE